MDQEVEMRNKINNVIKKLRKKLNTKEADSKCFVTLIKKNHVGWNVTVQRLDGKTSSSFVKA